MRVIAGSARGTVLRTIEGLNTRPTVDRVKEALFSSIQFNIRDARCLDGFAGSGALGIEALSRGASHVVFVDQSAECQKIIMANLDKTRFHDRATFILGDLLARLDRLGSTPFDLVFLDPPYGKGLCHTVLEALSARGLVGPSTIVICEHDETDVFEQTYGPLTLGKSKKYGKTYLTRFEGN